jgi:hypothetical protein
MEELEQIENKKAFRKIIYVIIGVILIAIVTTAFFIFRTGHKETFSVNENNLSDTGKLGDKTLYSSDTSTWKNYYWSGKINTHYPDNWVLKEKLGNSGVVESLEIIPPTEQASDTIFVGGDCSGLSKYAKSKCMSNLIQVPFYTDSQNKEVLAAFDLILSNTILIDIEK